MLLKINLFDRALNGFAGSNARRRVSSDKQGPTVVHQKPGPLQTIFNLPPDEVRSLDDVVKYTRTHIIFYMKFIYS